MRRLPEKSAPITNVHRTKKLARRREKTFNLDGGGNGVEPLASGMREKSSRCVTAVESNRNRQNVVHLSVKFRTAGKMA